MADLYRLGTAMLQLLFHTDKRMDKKSLVYSNVVKLIPTAIGPFTQFMLNPLKNPRATPSFLKHSQKLRNRNKMLR